MKLAAAIAWIAFWSAMFVAKAGWGAFSAGFSLMAVPSFLDYLAGRERQRDNPESL